MLDERHTRPGDDLISDLAASEVDGERLDREEVFDIVVQLVIAGNETTFRGVGTVMYALLTNPDQLALVQSDRSLVSRAVEEALRWEPPLPFDIRTAIRPTRLGEFDLEPGDIVMVCLASANRDEQYYDDGDRYWVMRPTPRPHLTFAAGPHVCLGTHLARMELDVSVRALLDRLPNLRFDPDEPAPVMRGALVRGPSRLPLVFDPT
jgi:cytochrome P450